VGRGGGKAVGGGLMAGSSQEAEAVSAFKRKPVQSIIYADDDDDDEGGSDDPSAAERTHAVLAREILENTKSTPAKMEEALIHLQRALFLKPTDVALYQLRAEVYLR
jgi:hypothetical protein